MAKLNLALMRAMKWNGQEVQACKLGGVTWTKPLGPDTFTTASPVQLGSYTGELGPWSRENGAAGAAIVEPQSVRSATTGTAIYALRGQTLPPEQFCDVLLTRGSGNVAGGAAPAVRVDGNNCYFLSYSADIDTLRLYRTVAGTSVSLGSVTNVGLTTPGSAIRVRISADGTTIRAFINGAMVKSATDVNLATGFPGIRVTGNFAPGEGVQLSDLLVGVPARKTA